MVSFVGLGHKKAPKARGFLYIKSNKLRMQYYSTKLYKLCQIKRGVSICMYVKSYQYAAAGD